MSKEIRVTISKDGTSVKVEAEGFVGESCKEATAPFIEAIGTFVEETDKPEFFHSYLPPAAAVKVEK